MKNTSIITIDWNKILTEFDNSELSANAFARKNGISPNALYWQLRKRRSKSAELNSQEVPLFIPVTSAPSSTGTISITVGQATINLEPDFDPQMLIRVVRALGAVC